jgi:hypothetical protein
MVCESRIEGVKMPSFVVGVYMDVSCMAMSEDTVLELTTTQ